MKVENQIINVINDYLKLCEENSIHIDEFDMDLSDVLFISYNSDNHHKEDNDIELNVDFDSLCKIITHHSISEFIFDDIITESSFDREFNYLTIHKLDFKYVVKFDSSFIPMNKILKERTRDLKLNNILK